MNLRWLMMTPLLATVVLSGCYVEEGGKRGLRREAPATPWPEDHAPDALANLADDLEAFLSATGRLPDRLTQLDETKLATGGPYAKHSYAYASAGIGALKEGWRIIAADDTKRVEGSVWCIVRAPVRVSGAPPFRVVRITLAEAQDAAAAAGGLLNGR